MRYTFAALAASLLFASGTIAAKMLADDLPACAFTLFRYGISSLCLLPFLIFRKERERVRVSDLPLLFFLGFTGVFLFNALYFTALSYASATSISLIGAVVPVMTMLGAALLFRHIPTSSELIAIILSFIGVSFIISNGSFSFACFAGNLGEFLMLLAVVCEALYILAIKKVSGHYSPLFLSFVTGVTGVIFVLPFIVNYCFVLAIAKLTLFQWGLLAYISSFGSALAIIFYSSAIKQIGPGRVSLLVFGSMPVFVAILALVLLGERLSVWQLLGGIVVVTALFLAERKRA